MRDIGHQVLLSNESGSRRIDVAEFIEFCIGRRITPAAALVELMKMRR